ncbi:GA module-containing protein, partial [Corynebacterium sp. MSK297]|uniref:GA module-containing protein n=1 Tax=Corynebacterium sp. MSK297 TaxID=3050221 RepID=UPI00254E91ED
VAERFVAQAQREGFSVDDAWKAEFRQLVSEKERELYPEYFAPSAQDYFDHHSGAIVAALRPADVSNAPGADAVAERFVAQAQREGFSVDDAWKAEFRELVQQLADKLEAEEAGAHRAVLNNELGVNSNPVVDPNEESLTAEGLAVPFAEHRDVVAEHEAAEELVESKEAAVAAIEGAVYLTENQKSQFIDRVNASAAVADVAAVVDQAHKLSDKQAAEEVAKGTLAKDKGEAHRIIEGLNKLSLERKAAFKKQVDDANTGAYVAHIVERAQELNQQHQLSGGVDEQESSQPGKDEKPGTDPKLGGAADSFKSFFDYAARLGVFAPIFGRFGVILENLRNAFAKTGIRF